MRPLIVLALLVGLLGMHGLLSDHHSGMSGTAGMSDMADMGPSPAAHGDPTPTLGAATGTAAACCLAVLAVGLGALLRRPEDGVERLAPPATGPRLSPVATAVRIPRPPDLADLCVLRL